MWNFKRHSVLLLALVGISFTLTMCKNIVMVERSQPQNQSSPPPQEKPQAKNDLSLWPKDKLRSYCSNTLLALPGRSNAKDVHAACAEIEQLAGCESVGGKPIIHYDRVGDDSKEFAEKKGKRILTLSLIHGDEVPSGSVARSWMERLSSLHPRNNWRVLPIVNPDGLKLRTRTNLSKVDLNRNFPTEDWEEKALHHWRADKKADPRRYPGPQGGSEPETQCLLKHLSEFKPDFIISIHTPLGVLDFDGPKMIKFPKFRPLPWISLGNFPGSLGRYMWTDRNVPVLTIELKGQNGAHRLAEFDRLQDISGTVAIQSSEVKKKTKSNDDVSSGEKENSKDNS